MMKEPTSAVCLAGDLALLVGKSHKNFIIRLTPGGQMQTHRGVVNHDDLIGLPWGSQVSSHIGSPFTLLQPSLADLLLETRRTTQILYPKDIGFILVMMGIGPGRQVIEAGTGSGALTTALAYAVGPQGRVISYEVREEMQKLAIKNLIRVGMDERVTFKLKDIGLGFDEVGVDALFLDVPNPEDFISQVRIALKPGGFFGCILPTTNQVTKLLPFLNQHAFAFIEVCEIFLRYYRPVAERLRPTDRMVAHTGYLVFARPILSEENNIVIQDAFENNPINRVQESKIQEDDFPTNEAAQNITRDSGISSIIKTFSVE
jgi:tRNA (adenine57-N1/adenine58-N1)-methyltransferase catalytic subunit